MATSWRARSADTSAANPHAGRQTPWRWRRPATRLRLWLRAFGRLEAFGGVGDVVHLGHVPHKLVPNPVGELEIGGVFWFGQRVALGDGKVEQDALFLKPASTYLTSGLGTSTSGITPRPSKPCGRWSCRRWRASNRPWRGPRPPRRGGCSPSVGRTARWGCSTWRP